MQADVLGVEPAVDRVLPRDGPARHGHRTVEVVDVRRAEARQVAARLRPRGRERRVRVDDAANIRERPVKDEVGLGVG